MANRFARTDRHVGRWRGARSLRGTGREPQRTESLPELLIDTVDGYAIFLLDEDGYIRTWNAEAERIKGYTSGEIIGKHVSVFYREDDVEAGVPERDLREARAEGRLTDEGWHVRADGSEFWADVTITALREEGELTGYVTVIHDSTQLHHERELLERNEQLKEHIAAISHDIRNPLAAAEGNVQLARETGDLSRLEATTRALDRATELLDYLGTLVEEGKRVAEPEPVDLAEVVEAAWAVVETDRAELVVDERAVLMADRQRLQELLENLLKNAVDHAGPDVTVRVSALDGGGFSVEDDGPGIPANRRAEVFEMGYSSDPDGTGYGLAICKQIVGAHGWSIDVREGNDGGCRFVVSAVDRT